MNINRAQNGFIKLHLKISDSDLWNDNNAMCAFLRMLFMAHYDDDFTSIRFAGEQRYLKRGEFSATLSELAVKLNLPLGTLRDVLRRLEESERISRQSDNRTTIFRICNYAKYQDNPTNRTANDPTISPTNDPTRPPLVKRYKKNNKDNTLREQKLLMLCNSILGRDFRTLPVGAKKTLEKFTDEEIERAFRNMLKDPWHKPRVQELKSPYLFRDSTIDSLKDFKSAVERSTEVKIVKVDAPAMPQLTRSEMLKREYEY